MCIRDRNPAVHQTFRNLINDEFVNQVRKDVEIMIRNLSQTSQPRQRTRASTYVSPPKPILPTPSQKRDVTRIEGIEEREVSPKAKAKATSTQAEAADSSGLTVEERAKVETVLNDFLNMKRRTLKITT